MITFEVGFFLFVVMLIFIGKILDIAMRRFLPRIANFFLSQIEARKDKKRARALQTQLKELESLPVTTLLEYIDDDNFLIRQRNEKLPLRIKAIQLLGAKGDSGAVEPLIRLLNDDNPAVRGEAVAALGSLGDSRAIEPLKHAFQKATSEESSQIKSALEQLGFPTENIHQSGKIFPCDREEDNNRTIEEWIAMLQNDAWQVRWKAAKRLGEIRDTRAVEPLMKTLEDKDWAVRAKTIEALGQMDDDKVAKPVVMMLRDTHPEVYTTVSQILPTLGEAAVESLLWLLRESNPFIRERAAKALGLIRDERVINPLLKVLGDRDSTVSQEAASALRTIGEPVIEHLAEAIDSNNKNRQWNAVVALGKLRDPRTVSTLLRVLDDDAHIRLKTAQILDSLGWEPQNEKERLTYSIAKEDWEAVPSFGARAISLLMKLAKKKNPRVRNYLVEYLKKACASVEIVVFGDDTPNNLDPHTTLINLDVSRLKIPLSQLKQIVLYTNSYDFPLVERFITYAVNHIGQKYLRKRVEVHIYGDPDTLHPNLRNSFKNLCNAVKEHKA